MASEKVQEVIEILLRVLGKKDVDGLTKSLRDVGDAADSSDEELTRLVGEMEKLERASTLAAEFTRLKAELAEVDNKAEQAEAGFRALNREFDASAKRTGEVGKAYKNAEKVIAGLEKQQAALRSQLLKTSDELTKAGVDTDKLADETARLDKEAVKTTADLTKQAAALKLNREAAERSAKAFETVAKNAGAVRLKLNEIAVSFAKVTSAAVTGAAALATYGAGKFFTSAIDQAGEFERVIEGVAAAAGGTADDVARLATAAEEAGKGLGFTGQQGAEGLEALARAGLDVTDSIGALPATLNLARAGALSVVESANLLADTLDQFGISGDRAAETADKIAKASLESGTSVAQLTAALTNAAPAAKGAGVDFETAAAAIGVLAQNGIEGGKAGAALVQIFSQLQDPASAFSKALDEAGIKSRDFTVVIEALARGGKGTEAAIQSLGNRGTAALQALTAKGGVALKQLTGDLANADGFSRKLAETFSDNVAIAFLEVERAYAAAKKSFVEPLLEPLAEELTALAKQIDEFAKSADFAELKESLKAIFLEGVEAVKAFAAEVDFKDVVQRIQKFAGDTKESFEEIRKDAADLVDALKTFGTSIQVVFNAIQTGVLGVATAVAKIQEITLQLLRMANAADRAVNPIRQLAEALGIVPDVAGALDEAIIGTQGVVEEFADRTATNARETREAMSDLGDGFKEGGEKALEGAQQVDAAATVVQGAAAKSDAAAQQSAATIQSIALQLRDATAASVEAAKQLQAAQAGGNQQQIDAAEANLAKTVAAVNKLEDANKAGAQAATDAGDAGEKAGTKTAAAADKASSAIDQQTGKVRATEGAMEGLSESASSAGNSFVAFISLLQELNNRFAQTSENARLKFVEIQRAEVRMALTLGEAIVKTLEAGEATQKLIDAQKTQLDGIAANLDAVAVAGEQAGYAFQSAFTAGSESLANFAENARAGRGGVDLLNQADLNRLGASADAAAQKIKAIEDAALEADAQIKQLNQSLQDQIDQRAGNEEAILKRRFEEEQQRIKDLAEQGTAAGRAQAEEARRLSEQNYLQELQQIRDLAAERNKSNSGGSSGGSSGAPATPRPSTAGPASQQPVTINVTVQGSVIGGTKEEIGEQLTRLIRPQLTKIERRTR